MVRTIREVGATPGSADLVLLNANVLTMDAARPRAQAVALGGGRILAVGSNVEVRGWITSVIDPALSPPQIRAYQSLARRGRPTVHASLMWRLDPYQVDPDAISEIAVLLTLVDGQPVFEA